MTFKYTDLGPGDLGCEPDYDEVEAKAEDDIVEELAEPTE
jgi:hypothetical protein